MIFKILRQSRTIYFQVSFAINSVDLSFYTFLILWENLSFLLRRNAFHVLVKCKIQISQSLPKDTSY